MKYYFLSILTVIFSVSLLLNSCGMETKRDFRTLSPGDDAPSGGSDGGGVSFPGGVKTGGDKDGSPPVTQEPKIPNTALGWDGLSHLEPVAFEIISVE